MMFGYVYSQLTMPDLEQRQTLVVSKRAQSYSLLVCLEEKFRVPWGCLMEEIGLRTRVEQVSRCLPTKA